MIVGALDIGGTHASAARVDVSAATLERGARVALESRASRAEVLASIVGVAAEVGGGRVTRFGVAVPGPFDYGRGISLIAHKLEQLHGVDLRRELATGLGLPPSSISFVNDADAFLLGEWWAGAAAGHARAVGITLGTGLGSAFLEHGEIVDGGPRVPPEGSLHLVAYRGRPAEETISRGALIARYGSPSLDVEEIAALARAGDDHAVVAFREVAFALGEIVAPWIASFQATCLVVGGSIARAWDLLAPGLRQGLGRAERLQALLPAARIDEAALLGAARHVADQTRVPGVRLGSAG